MADKEIKIEEYELKNYEGNLKSLLNAWNSMPVINVSPANKSTGYSANAINNNCEGAMQVKNEFKILLRNSIGFFENLGITFLDVDNEIANTISGK